MTLPVLGFLIIKLGQGGWAMWEKIINLLFWIVVAGLTFQGLTSQRAHEGDPCGPHHYWRYVNVDASGGDLSCEPS